MVGAMAMCKLDVGCDSAFAKARLTTHFVLVIDIIVPRNSLPLPSVI
ncbi:hypothetical protein JCM19294_1200 [Nonlabens tegetincola]|uniref:Uncharacterized protein n=1 Tax=Nonlabens tegetincola TaxID=323273 RepID=A0A090QMZ5_9FLAO|nr:hypothetical protein JCM19294_1200 [Nonlabens tegetincola]